MRRPINRSYPVGTAASRKEAAQLMESARAGRIDRGDALGPDEAIRLDEPELDQPGAQLSGVGGAETNEQPGVVRMGHTDEEALGLLLFGRLAWNDLPFRLPTLACLLGMGAGACHDTRLGRADAASQISSVRILDRYLGGIYSGAMANRTNKRMQAAVLVRCSAKQRDEMTAAAKRAGVALAAKLRELGLEWAREQIRTAS